MPDLNYYRENNGRLYDSLENDESLDKQRLYAMKIIFGLIESGDFERLEKELENFNITKEEVLARPEMIEAAKMGALRAFTGAGMLHRNYSDWGDFQLGKRLIEEFTLPEPEIESIAKNSFLENIDQYRRFDNEKLVESGYIDEQFINSPEVTQRVKDSILRILNKNFTYLDISAASAVADYYKVDEAWLRSPEIQSLVIKKLSAELSSNVYDGVKNAKERFGLSEDQIKEAGIGALALAPGSSDRDGAILYAGLDHLDIEKGDELGAITNLKRGYVSEKSCEYLKKHEDDSEYRDWLKQGIAEAIRTWNFFSLKLMKENLKDFDSVFDGIKDEFWPEIETKYLELAKSDTGGEDILIMGEIFDFPASFFEKEENIQVAKECFLLYLKYRGARVSIELMDKFQFDPNFLRQQEVWAAQLDVLAWLIKQNSDLTERFVSSLGIDKKTISIVARTVVEREMSDSNIENAYRIYQDLEQGDKKIIDKAFFLGDYMEDLSLADKSIYANYRRLKMSGDEMQLRGYVDKIKGDIGNLISGQEQLSPNDPEYKSLVTLTYPSHSNNWTSFESNESCPDRSSDLDRFKIKPVYEINLGQGVEMILRDGEFRDKAGLDKLNNLINIGIEAAKRLGYDKEAQRREIDAMLAEMSLSLDPSVFRTREEKIYGLLLESLVGRFSPEKLKEVIIRYQMCEFEDIKTYIQETQDRAGQAKNPEYAYLLQLREFFADNIKEVQRSIAHEAQKNQAIIDATERYYKIKSEESSKENAQDKLNRLRVDRLGLQGNLLDRILKELSKKTDRKGNEYKLVNSKDGEISVGKKGEAIASMIEAEQRKAAQVIEAISNQQIDPKDIHLGELNLQEYIDLQDQEKTGEYDHDLFGRYLVQAFQGIFESELTFIDKELAKFVPKEEKDRDKKRKTVEGFIVKHHASAHARAVGGVCVSGDNPMKNEKCQWNLPNFFQMVLRDKDSRVCQGLVLLHYYEDQGRRILTASLNPSSTYLYKVNETDMLNGIIEQLGVFCDDNGIDYVTVSINQGIRTNRTGGEFENALDKKIKSIGKKVTLENEEPFSYSPVYNQKELDVVWEKKEEVVKKEIAPKSEKKKRFAIFDFISGRK